MKSLLFPGLVVLMSVTSFSGSLDPLAPPTAGTMKPLTDIEPRIAVNAANTPGDPNNTFIISSPGSYYLTGNLTSNFKHAVLIDADDVNLDLMGCRLWSSYSKPLGNLEFDGIHIAADHKNITIQNGSVVSDNTVHLTLTFRGFRHGVYAETGTNRVRLMNMQVADARDDGIFMSGEQHVVKACTVTDNEEVGIHLDGDAHRVQDCVITHNGDTGVDLDGDNQQIFDCRVIGNQRNGLRLNGNHQTVQRCTVSHNKYHGIYLGSDGDNSLVTDCIAAYNGVSISYMSTLCGINVGSGCTVRGNTANYNGRLTTGYTIYGIAVMDNCTVAGNTVQYNGDQSSVSHYINGIRIGSGCTVQGNTVAYNGKDVIEPTMGIRGINAVTGCSIIANTVRSNGSGATDPACGIRVQSHCLVDGNTSYGHDDNLQITFGECTLGTNCFQ